MMGGASSLTLEEYQIYAAASTVKDFYYTLTAYFNGSDAFEPVSTDSSDSNSSGDGLSSGRPSGFPGMMGGGMSGGRMPSGGMGGGMGPGGHGNRPGGGMMPPR